MALADSAWQTFNDAMPQGGRAFLIRRGGAWREPRFVAHLDAMLEYEGWWRIEWRYATAVEIAGRV